jgi:glycosyltransferase involved in cell wall biosynthesis
VTALHVVLPVGVDDPAHPSGGNLYDRRICDGLAATGWQLHEHQAAGCWPWPDSRAEAALARLLAAVPDDALVLVDGLIASAVPSVLVPEADRLRLVVLVHLPLGEGPPGHQVAEAEKREGAVLSAARAVLSTSAWTRRRLLARYPLAPDRVHVAEPGVDPAPPAAGTGDGGELLCVAAVTEHKGHDLLLTALADLADRPWRCVCVGALDREPDFVDRLRRQAADAGIGDRVCWRGALSGQELDQAYAGADALVLASRAETYGMVVTEALARGLPVIATAVGGLPETLGWVAGERPGLLVPPADPAALAAALRDWLTDRSLRQDLRRAAQERRRSLTGWARTTGQVARALVEAAA